ncbi:NOL1/NOP2/sun doamin containing protein, partial [Spraguea lophii 42_110]
LSHILSSLEYYYTPFPFIFVLNQPIDSLVQKYIKEDLIFIQDISSTLPAMLFSFDNNNFLKDKENKCKCMKYNNNTGNNNNNYGNIMNNNNKKDTINITNDNDNKLPSIVDCCAAPGNKSTQLLMLYNCNLVSIEKDRLRYNTLIKFISKIKRNITKESICNVINTLNIDFFDYNTPTEYIILDPSCSGSGIHKIYIKDKERIEKLHILQTNILSHALSLNPKRLVYSTCSIHREENEDVIKYILENNNNYKLISVKEELENIIERYTHNKILLNGITEYMDRNINDN